MNDLEIVAKLKRGVDDVFPVVAGKYQKLVLNCAFKFVRNRESAEDITQEVFLEVFESIHTFRGDSKLSTWIYQIAVSKSLNHLKSLNRKKRFAIFVSLFESERAEDRSAAMATMGPEGQLENQDRARILSWALSRLPDNQRIAFTLSKYDELSYEEISSIMNMSVSSIESLLYRAKVNLKKILSRYYKEHL
jgi:RNA polymerase sigma-70 factor (ECF subfamily)